MTRPRVLVLCTRNPARSQRAKGFPENTASLALHERCGFRVVGVYRRHGKLEGQWLDEALA